MVLGYVEDGRNLVTMAMNGWGPAEPAWWLNLQAHPDAEVRLAGGPRLVRAHAAAGEERSRLWARWREIDKNLDAYAALRSTETAVVVFEPRPGSLSRLSRATDWAWSQVQVTVPRRLLLHVRKVIQVMPDDVRPRAGPGLIIHSEPDRTRRASDQAVFSSGVF